LSSDVRLSIREIYDANPVWLRPDNHLLPVDKLKASLAEKGMLFPVLLRSDFVMLDGARRVLAADVLRWKEVPVVVAHNWDTVVSHYELANKLEAEEGLERRPMTWMELDELWTELLKPIHQERRSQQSVRERARRASLRERGVPEAQLRKGNAYTGYVMQCADLFGFRPIHVKLIREICHTYRRLRVKHPEIEEPFQRLIAQAESLGAETASSMRQFVRNVWSLGVSVTEADRRATESLRNARAAPWRLARRTPKQNNRPEAFEPQAGSLPVYLPAVQKLITSLDQLSWEAGQMHDFQNIEPEDIAVLKGKVRTATNRIHAMRRRLEAHGERLQGEREQ